MKLIKGYTRIEGEADSEERTYELKLWFGRVTLIFLSKERVIIQGGGFFPNKPQIAWRGSQRYDAITAQMNALEDGIYHHGKFWRQLAAAWYVWKRAGSPKVWNGRRVPDRIMARYEFYEDYSPMTWKP